MQKTKDFSQTERDVHVVKGSAYINNLRLGLDRLSSRSFEQDFVSALKDSQRPINRTPALVDEKAALPEDAWRQCSSFYWHL